VTSGTGTTSSTAAPQGSPHAPAAGVFVTTHWSVVLAASDSASPESSHALEALCRTYWYPLYAYVRRLGRSPEDAEDLTQAFFARFLEKQWVADADRQRGRFRSFLLSSFKHFLANEWDKARARKRGGGIEFTSLNTTTAETRYQQEPPGRSSPDWEFDRRWALALLDTVLGRLQREYANEGKAAWFGELKATLAVDRAGVAYADIARRLGTTEGAVKVAVHRLRQRYRVLLRTEIAHTVASPAEVEEELRHLFAVLSD
jgi:RNA polymerase sigma factor (sigma-70 family)